MNEAAPEPLSDVARNWQAFRRETGDLFGFIRAPRRTWHDRGPWLGRFLLLWGLCVAVATLQAPLQLVIEYFAPSIQFKPLPDTTFMVLAILVAPLAEELVFRAGLRSARYTLLVGPALYGASRCAAVPAALAVLGVFALAMLADWLYQRRLAHPGWRMRRGRAFVRRYPWVFWLYAAAFASLHLNNFAYSGLAVLAMPLVLLPQLFCGLVFGYLRLRHGLLHSMLLHAAYNAGLCSVLLLD